MLPSLAAQFAAFEALLFIASAGHKLARWTYSRGVLREFARIPARLATPVLAGVAGMELLCAALLIVPTWRMVGAMLALVLWAAYLALIARAIVEGRREVDCGCTLGTLSRPLGLYSLSRNAVLLALAVSVAWVSWSDSVPVQASQALAACALLALYGALDQVMALAPLRAGTLR